MTIMVELLTYNSRNFTGKPMEYHPLFLPALQLADELAERLGLKIHATSSFRRPGTKLQGAIVNPAAASNHFIGCAFDCNFKDKHGTWWNSSKLKKPEGDVLEFITEWKAAGYRWGGDFTIKDVVHFDNGLNLSAPKMYADILKQIGNAPVIKQV